MKNIWLKLEKKEEIKKIVKKSIDDYMIRKGKINGN